MGTFLYQDGLTLEPADLDVEATTAPMLSLGVLLELLQKLVMIPYPEKTCDR